MSDRTDQPVPAPEGGHPDPDNRADRGGQAFWSLVVGVPALLSVLRLWVEAGGELQTTLLLVANVGPVNLGATWAITTMWLATTGLVAVFAIGGVLLATTATDEATTATDQPGTDRSRPLLFARLTRDLPGWVKIGTFILAALTWQILYLPLLLLACCAAFQISPFRWRVSLFHRHGRLVGALIVGLTLVGVGLLVFPTIRAAMTAGEWFVVLLLAAPPLLAIWITGPLVPKAAKPIGLTAQTAVLAYLALAFLPLLTAPVLPLTVTVVRAAGSDEPEYVRGHVIAVDDVHNTILQEHGGVRFIDNDEISSRVICANEEELPRYRLWVHGFYIEDSILRAIGRDTRPVEVSPICHKTAEPAG